MAVGVLASAISKAAVVGHIREADVVVRLGYSEEVRRFSRALAGAVGSVN